MYNGSDKGGTVIHMWHHVAVLTFSLARVNAMDLIALDWFCVLAKGAVLGG